MTDWVALSDAFGYGIAILLALIGWGGLVGRLVFAGRATDWGLRAGWGLALTIFLGGVLEAGRWVSRAAIGSFLAAGWVLFFWGIVRWVRSRRAVSGPGTRARGRKGALTIAVLLGALLLARYGAWVGDSVFNEHDDLQAYLVYPEKMLQTGAQGIDPFSERRVVASLGGQTFLYAIALTHVKEQHLHMIDPGLALLILGALVVGGSGRVGLPVLTVNVCLAFLAVMNPPTVNLTMLVMGAALFLALFRTLTWIERNGAAPLPNAVIASLLLSAIAAGKSSLIPAGVLFLGFSYFLGILKSPGRGKAALEAGLVGAVTLVMLLPWMLSMYRSCGTLLYPLLGKGFHGSAYGLYETASAGMTPKRVLSTAGGELLGLNLVVLGLLTAAAHFAGRLTTNGRGALLSMVVGTWAGMAILLVAMAGYGFERYAFPFVLACILALLMGVLTNRSDGQPEPLACGSRVLVLIGLAAGFWGGGNYRECISNHRDRIAARGNVHTAQAADQARRYEAMQDRVPPGQVILERLDRPYVLDFRRNPVFVVDYPGGQSLPPGMPLFRGGEILAGYLSAKSIRYVAYSYATHASFGREAFASRLRPSENPWIRSEARCTFDFQDSLDELRQSRRLLYDDGEVCLMDLLTKH